MFSTLSFFSKSFNNFIDFDIVSQLVNIPPNHLLLTKYWPDLVAESLIGSCACLLVPTKSILPPLLAISRRKFIALYSIGTVC